MATDQELWSSPCSYLCCFLKRGPGDETDGGSPDQLVLGSDTSKQYGTIKAEEEEVSWNDLAHNATEQDNIDEGIVITDDVSMNTDTDEHNIVLTNPNLPDKLLPASCTSDEDEISGAHNMTYAKDVVQNEILEAGEKEPGHDVPSPVPEESIHDEEPVIEEQGEGQYESLDVPDGPAEGAVEGAVEGEGEEHIAPAGDHEHLAAQHTQHSAAEPIEYLADNNIDKHAESDSETTGHLAAEAVVSSIAPDVAPAARATPEPVLILPSSPVNPPTPPGPPSITVTAEETAGAGDVPSQSIFPPQEFESASDMDNEMGSTQSLSKKKKSKFKKFFKLRKKKKKEKYDEQYKSTPSLSPVPSEQSQGTIRSVYSMSSVLNTLDPDERNIASD